VILGKTVTTELAYFSPSKTKNPHDPSRTPGGSSSGSAAAVASAMAPLAIGTQTNGSMIRPAAFCGVVGFKPTRGLIPRTGVLAHSHHLDTVGVFARSVADAALLADSLIGHDPYDPATFPAGSFQLTEAAAAAPPLPPQFAFVRSPVWDKAEPETQEAFAALAEDLGERCEAVDLPPAFAESQDLLVMLMTAGFAHRLGGYHDRGKEQLSDQMRRAIESGRQVAAHEYLRAVDRIDLMNVALEQIFSRYDAILTPAAPGVAPIGLTSTGDPVFCSTWQLAGTPAISLPLLHGESGLPIGVQLVGRRGDDHRLIRTAAWLSQFVTAAATDERP
jgi:Asp-tRNA(Asn)/Glu-tRNA(Gln) amidotransferase A subunit family amidase